MSLERDESITWQGDPLESPYFQHIAKFAIPRNIDSPAVYEALLDVANDPSDTVQLKEALFYLEHAGWKAKEASLLLELDISKRQGCLTISDGNSIDNHMTNQSIDTQVAQPGAKFDLNLCELTLVVKGVKHVSCYPNLADLDSNSQDDIDKLNHWRQQMICKYTDDVDAGRGNGQKFHSIEIDYLLNRYAAQEVDSQGRCRYADIVEDYNAVFEGVFLPGNLKRLTRRTQESITSILTRKAVNPQNEAKRWPKEFNGLMRHEAAQRRIREEWNERLMVNKLTDRKQENVAEKDKQDGIQKWVDAVTADHQSIDSSNQDSDYFEADESNNEECH